MPRLKYMTRKTPLHEKFSGVDPARAHLEASGFSVEPDTWSELRPLLLDYANRMRELRELDTSGVEPATTFLPVWRRER